MENVGRCIIEIGKPNNGVEVSYIIIVICQQSYAKDIIRMRTDSDAYDCYVSA